MARFRDMLERSYAEKESFLGNLAGELTAPAARDAELMAPNRTPPNINAFINNSPIFPTGDYFSIAQHAYMRNELIAFGVGLIMNGVAKAPLRVYDRDENELNDHPLRELIRKPNPFMGETALMELTVMHYFLSGNAFWVKVRGAGLEPIELWPLRPDRMRIIPDKDKFIAGYIYEIAGKQYPLDTADVLHIKRPHPTYDYWGLSPLSHAMRRVAIDNEAADFLKVTLQNYGVPPLFVTAQQVVSPDDAKRLHKQLDEVWAGRNRGKPAILQQGMDVKTVGQSLEQLVLPELDEISQKRVLVAIYVPPVLAGQEATFSNYDMARQFMYQNACMPLQGRIDDVIERDLLSVDFDPSGKLSAHFDVSEVPELEPLRSAKRKDAIAAVQGGVIMLNEGRKVLGEEADPAGDVYLRPINLVAVPAGQTAPETDDDTTNPQENALRKFRALNPHILLTRDGSGGTAPETRLLVNRFAGNRDLKTLSRVVLHRGNLADRYQDKFRTWARTELARQSRDIKRAVTRRYHALTKDQVTQITEELAALELQWRRDEAASVTPLMMGLVGDAAIDASETELGIRFDLSNQTVLDFVRTYAYKFADKTSDTSASEVRDLLTRAETEGWSVRELTANLDGLSESWDTARAGTIARTETIRAANAGAIASYKAAGITLKVWISDAGSCPYCAALNGKVIGIDDAFLKMGQSYQPDGAKAPMTVSYEDVNGPPAHPNCRCAVRAEVQ